ncbi:MAG: aromatic ring-hydroxylating dioxygenase subunit alpha [Lyngbya sp.]|nr:aromatic ring-hydroxylating dioxygenase subunit alpha [Lyngbya sp.]
MTTQKLTDNSMETVQSFLKADTRKVPSVLLETTSKNLGNANIPNDIFFSQDAHNLEVEKLWKKVWQWVCREENLANVGDYITYEIADLSVILVRGTDYKIRGFYNSCLHRGTQLCVDQGHALALRCPFHGWTWKLDGTLSHIPCEWDFEQVDNQVFKLPEVKVETWQEFVFINFDPNSESLESYLENIPEHFQQFALKNRFIAAHAVKVMPANWKVVLGAFLEAYHSITTHPQILKFTGDANSQYDIYGRHNRMITPFAVTSPHLGKSSDPLSAAKAFLAFGGTDINTINFPENGSSRPFAAEVSRQAFQQLTGVDYTEVSDAEMLDAISYFIFPNFMSWPGVGSPLQFRFRPYGNNPDASIMDILLLRPFVEGNRPTAAPTRWLTSEQKWADAPELGGLGGVLDQDTSNLYRIQKGLKTSAKTGITLGKYQESRIRHFHNTLTQQLQTE